MGARIGIFGGTFDPPHHGHLILGTEAAEILHLDTLLFIPTADPPHKEKVATPAEVRLRMVEAAVEGEDRFQVDDLELRRGGISYTVDTLKEIRSRNPDAELVFLLGIDQFREFASWRDPDEVAQLARLAVFARAGETLNVSGPYQAVEVRAGRVDISSTQIRHRVREGKSIRYFVPEAVREIIEGQGLYRTLSSRA